MRLVIGSWKITAASRPRTVSISNSVRLSRSRPLSRTEPEMRANRSGSSRMTDSIVTLLPEPDSPTMATVSRASTSRLTSWTTGVQRPWRSSDVVRDLISSTLIGAPGDVITEEVQTWSALSQAA